MASRIEEHFADGRLVRPTANTPNLVHLVRAISSLAGVAQIERSPVVRVLQEMIAPAEHLVFILLDGLGMSILERLPKDCFLRKTFRTEIQASSPSTTACALTSIATGAYPNEHGVVGWFTHLPDQGFTSVVLPFLERGSDESLVKRGMRIEEVIPLPPIMAQMTHQPLTLMPLALQDTPYANWSRGYTRGKAYTGIKSAIDQVIWRIGQDKAPTYTHVYFPDIDTLCHAQGATGDQVLQMVLRVDRQLEQLAEAICGRARVVVSADHGLIDVPLEQQTILQAGDPLLEMLQAPPTGDGRMPVFHLRADAHAAFVEHFCQRLGERFHLMRVNEIEAMELFGPGRLSALTRARLGDFVAIPLVPATLGFQAPGKPVKTPHRAVHAGLSPQEMRIPLCVF